MNYSRRFFIGSLLIILVATFLRFYQLEQRAVFYFDESYDAFQIRKMIITQRPTLLGHPYSVSGTYQGPLYYYLVAPALLIANYNPTAIAAMMAIVNLFALIFLGYFTYRFFGENASVFAMSFYAISPAILELARKSWYPAPIELLAPLCIYLLYLSRRGRNFISSFLGGLLAGMTMQFHILSYPLVVFGSGLFLFYRKLLSNIFFILGVLIGFLPVLIFEFRHNFFNTQMAYAYISSHSHQTFLSYLQQIIAILQVLMSGLFGQSFYLMVTGSLISISGWLMAIKKQRELTGFLTAFAVISLLGAGLFSGEMNFHYVAILHFLPVLFCGIVLHYLFRLISRRFIRLLLVGIILIFAVFLLKEGPLTKTVKWSISQARQAAKIIADDVKPGDQFNVVLLEHAESRAWPLRYFLDVYGVEPMAVEEYPKSEIVYVVAKDLKMVQTIDLWELRAAGPSVMEKQWPLDFGYWLFKMRYPHPSSKSDL